MGETPTLLEEEGDSKVAIAYWQASQVRLSPHIGKWTEVSTLLILPTTISCAGSGMAFGVVAAYHPNPRNLNREDAKIAEVAQRIQEFKLCVFFATFWPQRFIFNLPK